MAPKRIRPQAPPALDTLDDSQFITDTGDVPSPQHSSPTHSLSVMPPQGYVESKRVSGTYSPVAKKTKTDESASQAKDVTAASESSPKTETPTEGKSIDIQVNLCKVDKALNMQKPLLKNPENGNSLLNLELGCINKKTHFAMCAYQGVQSFKTIGDVGCDTTQKLRLLTPWASVQHEDTVWGHYKSIFNDKESKHYNPTPKFDAPQLHESAFIMDLSNESLKGEDSYNYAFEEHLNFVEEVEKGYLASIARIIDTDTDTPLKPAWLQELRGAVLPKIKAGLKDEARHEAILDKIEDKWVKMETTPSEAQKQKPLFNSEIRKLKFKHKLFGYAPKSIKDAIGVKKTAEGVLKSRFNEPELTQMLVEKANEAFKKGGEIMCDNPLPFFRQRTATEKERKLPLFIRLTTELERQFIQRDKRSVMSVMYTLKPFVITNPAIVIRFIPEPKAVLWLNWRENVMEGVGMTQARENKERLEAQAKELPVVDCNTLDMGYGAEFASFGT